MVGRLQLFSFLINYIKTIIAFVSKNLSKLTMLYKMHTEDATFSTIMQIPGLHHPTYLCIGFILRHSTNKTFHTVPFIYYHYLCF